MIICDPNVARNGGTLNIATTTSMLNNEFKSSVTQAPVAYTLIKLIEPFPFQKTGLNKN